jgi:tol-pal system protein YbgF
MKRKFLNVLGMIAIICLMGGCLATTNRVTQQEQEIRALQQQIRDLQEQLQLQSLQYNKTLDQTRRTLPELRMELDRLKTDMQGLRDHVERNQMGNRIGADGYTMNDQLNVMGQRMDRVESQLKLPPIPENPSGMSPPPTTVPSASPQGGYGTQSQAESPDTIKFREAKSLFDMKAYREALPRFRAFLREFPESNLASAAQLYIGECRYNTNDFEDAILAYQKVVKDYPNSKEVPHALTKQAFSFLSIGDKTSAEFLLKKVIRMHPDNYWAGVAQKKLSTL